MTTPQQDTDFSMNLQRVSFKLAGIITLLFLNFQFISPPLLLAMDNPAAMHIPTSTRIPVNQDPDVIPPAMITDLVAQSGSTIGTINLTWTSPGDDGATGTASTYIVRYNTEPITEDNWDLSTDMSGEPTPHLAGSIESMTITRFSPEIYYFAIKTQDEVPNMSVVSNVASASAPAFSTVYLPLVLSPDTSISEMVLIPAGNYQMGCAQEQYVSPYCPGTVYLEAYLIDKYEVTNAQYARCVAAGSCTAPARYDSYTHSSYYGNPTYATYPVNNVTLNQTADYCAWAGKRLPNDAEWEKAARGGNNTHLYPWGDRVPDCTLANYNMCVGDTSAVGSYPTGASPYGVMDMAGNVSEWVIRLNNPHPPGVCQMLRGGSWSHDEVSATYREYLIFFTPDFQGRDVGFRCVGAVP